MGIVNFYGASESLALGVETDPAEGVILFDDMNILEQAPDGVYLTCLYNFAQPLIRYKLSDSLTFQPPGDKYPFRRAVGLLGRCEDLLWFENGAGAREFLHPLAVEGFCIEGLLDYQFRQTGSRSFEMLAETAPTASQENHPGGNAGADEGNIERKRPYLCGLQRPLCQPDSARPPDREKRLIVQNREERSVAV